MDPLKNEELLRQMAKEYIKKTGEEYDSEAEELNLANKHMPRRPSHLKKKTRRWIPWVSVAAACATIVFVVLNVSIFTKLMNGGFSPDANSPTDVLGPPAATHGSYGTYPQIILLGSRFEIADVEADNGQVIYTINDIYGDNAVAILMPAEDFDHEGMKKNDVGYYKMLPDYKVVAVEKGEWVLHLSCTHEIQTLENLYDEIKIIL